LVISEKLTTSEMKLVITKYNLILYAIFYITCFQSCYIPDPPVPPRPVSCEMPPDYNYLDYYERWSEPICSSEICSIYTSIWRELLIERTTLTEPYFDKHFEITSSNIRSESEGDYFIIGFRVHNDWAIAYSADRFIIRIAEEATEFPEIGLPKGDYLTKEQIATALDRRGFESDIDNIPKTGPLKYATPDEALNVLISATNVDTLCFYLVKLDFLTGTLTLNAYARYDDAEDECIEASIDLITGRIGLREKTCSKAYDR